MFMLNVQSGKHAGKRVKLPAGESIVGRDEGAKVRIASSEVSRQHCKLLVTARSVTVVDLNSSNGTYVDGIPINGETELRPGGTLTVGPMTFRLEGGEPPMRRAIDLPRESDERAKQALSDDDIASLLSADEIPTISASDTTIHGEDSVVIPSPPPLPQTSSTKAAAPRVFKSVGEEGREIIRLHRESLEAAGESGPAR
jgi:pSer/pThr/pTyr-binding forkhead associated (FHA) protein